MSRFLHFALMLATAFQVANSAHARGKVMPSSTRVIAAAGYENCIAASGGITVAMRNCAAIEYRRLDRELNSIWRETMTRQPDDAARVRLRADQRHWLKTRSAACEQMVAASGMGGGTVGLLIGDDCAIMQLNERINWLKAHR